MLRKHLIDVDALSIIFIQNKQLLKKTMRHTNSLENERTYMTGKQA